MAKVERGYIENGGKKWIMNKQPNGTYKRIPQTGSGGGGGGGDTPTEENIYSVTYFARMNQALQWEYGCDKTATEIIEAVQDDKSLLVQLNVMGMVIGSCVGMFIMVDTIDVTFNFVGIPDMFGLASTYSGYSLIHFRFNHYDSDDVSTVELYVDGGLGAGDYIINRGGFDLASFGTDGAGHLEWEEYLSGKLVVYGTLNGTFTSEGNATWNGNNWVYDYEIITMISSDNNEGVQFEKIYSEEYTVGNGKTVARISGNRDLPFTASPNPATTVRFLVEHYQSFPAGLAVNFKIEGEGRHTVQSSQ